MLYVRPRKAHNLVKKNFFKGGFMHSTATGRVFIAGQSKKTAQVDGSNPTFSDVLEFILGGERPLHLTPCLPCCTQRPAGMQHGCHACTATSCKASLSCLLSLMGY